MEKKKYKILKKTKKNFGIFFFFFVTLQHNIFSSPVLKSLDSFLQMILPIDAELYLG